MKTHTLGAGQFIKFIVPVKGMKLICIMWTADMLKSQITSAMITSPLHKYCIEQSSIGWEERQNKKLLHFATLKYLSCFQNAVARCQQSSAQPLCYIVRSGCDGETGLHNYFPISHTLNLTIIYFFALNNAARSHRWDHFNFCTYVALQNYLEKSYFFQIYQQLQCFSHRSVKDLARLSLKVQWANLLM